jgi:hypothetical protein
MARNQPRRSLRFSAAKLVAVVAVAAIAVGLFPTAGGASGVSGGRAGECQISQPATGFTSLVVTSPNHAQVWRLYQATFLRQPKPGGLDYWVEQRNRGASLTNIARYFTDGPEFRNRYGSLSDLEFVRLVYRNILCRTPEAKGEAYWTGHLQRGNLTRPALIVGFTELREYLRVTQTCHSIYSQESEASQHCWVDGVVPLTSATMGANGYRAFDRSLPRATGGVGSFRGVEVDMTRAIASGVFSTGSNRCSVASINTNWLVVSEKDRPDPGALGLGVVDGAHVRNSADRTDRGVFGLRVDASPKSVVQVWPGDTLSADDVRLNSVMFHEGSLVVESWHAAAEMSPYLLHLEPEQQVGANEWIWAAAGVPLRVDGQTDGDFNRAYNADPYTYQTLNHPFVAVDKQTRRLIFGATSTLDARDLVNWATAHGYEELIMFDGGASTEFNVGGRAVVGGTSRDIPIWLGIGC